MPFLGTCVKMRKVNDETLRQLWLNDKYNFSFSGSKNFQSGLLSELGITASLNQIRRILSSIPSYTISVLRQKQKTTR